MYIHPHMYPYVPYMLTLPAPGHGEVSPGPWEVGVEEDAVGAFLEALPGHPVAVVLETWRRQGRAGSHYMGGMKHKWCCVTC